MSCVSSNANYRSWMPREDCASWSIQTEKASPMPKRDLFNSCIVRERFSLLVTAVLPIGPLRIAGDAIESGAKYCQLMRSNQSNTLKYLISCCPWNASQIKHQRKR